MLKLFQKGFNYSQDGPGNRLVYHMQGCNFHCIWCSNPEGMGKFCGKTTQCSVDAIIDECCRSKMMFFDGGGVTFTGGEPTVQFEQLYQVLARLKMLKINTAIETNGSCNRLVELLPYVDFLIMDLKHYDGKIHKKWVGVDNKTTLDNLNEISARKRQLLLRIPVINGFNNTPFGFAEYFQNLDMSNISIEILPYHEYGKAKWTEKYEPENCFVTKKDLDLFYTVFNNYGFNIIKT